MVIRAATNLVTNAMVSRHHACIWVQISQKTMYPVVNKYSKVNNATYIQPTSKTAGQGFYSNLNTDCHSLCDYFYSSFTLMLMCSVPSFSMA